jgi:hypothetical protein
MLVQRRGGVARTEEDNREALRRWPSSLATRGAALEQELASGGAATAASGGAAAAAEETEEEERGGVGADVQFQKLQGPRCKTRFSHCFISQMRKWSK